MEAEADAAEELMRSGSGGQGAQDNGAAAEDKIPEEGNGRSGGEEEEAVEPTEAAEETASIGTGWSTSGPAEAPVASAAAAAAVVAVGGGRDPSPPVSCSVGAVGTHPWRFSVENRLPFSGRGVFSVSSMVGFPLARRRVCRRKRGR